ncbi:HalX domain-containing protein [Natronomonas salina]|uniref:HalX domain-containing protein n=1 Tax=Natronomonas salina TaxID=1710540 RepID=UPI0015B645F4|nr:HalX domain-containing protein [Natronomonas salina]QLD89267.1 HalX domain-containing protein [Natronomonas salina]
MTEDTQTVLVVDDERDLADLYAAWLESDYEVRTAYGGEGAIEALDESVDVALIDRLMPTISGDEVLEYVRSEGYECRVAMVTAVEPDFDIIEMGFDEYIVKPIRHGDLTEVVESLVSRSTYDRQLQEFFALASKRAALQSQKSAHELDESEAYADLEVELEELRDELHRTTEQLSVRDLEVELRQLNADGSPNAAGRSI